MKKAEEWINTNGFIDGHSVLSSPKKSKEMLINLIKQIQKDAIKETITECMMHIDIWKTYKPLKSTTTQQLEIKDCGINLEQFVDIKNRLIKELNNE